MNECNEELFGQFLRPIINEGLLEPMATESNFYLSISSGSYRDLTKKNPNLFLFNLCSTIHEEYRLRPLTRRAKRSLLVNHNLYTSILIQLRFQQQNSSKVSYFHRNVKSKGFISFAASLLLNDCVNQLILSLKM